jgi:hypothetical protein
MGVTDRPQANWTERSFYLSLGVAVALLAGLALVNGQGGLALLALLVGVGWAGVHRLGGRWRWFSPLAFLLLGGEAVVGLVRGFPAGGLVIGVAAALAAWDLDGFAAYLARFGPNPEQTPLLKKHLGRLLVVLGGGVILGEAALVLRVTLSLGWVATLGILAMVILLQAVRQLGGEPEVPVRKKDD